MKNKSFTLIELMLVIAIIAILASLLLPSLRRAQILAKQAICLSQEKQFGIAARTYSSDNKREMPFGQPNRNPFTGNLNQEGQASVWSDSNSWYGLGLLYQGKYMETPEMYECPMDEVSYKETWGWFRSAPSAWMNWTYTSYYYFSNFDHQPGVKWGRPVRTTDPGSTAIAADHFAANSHVNTHQKGYNVLYLDGSATFFKDPNMHLSYIPSYHMDFDGMYTVWKTFDR